MSTYVPFELQDEIIKRLPAKSLLRFRTVSQRWRTLIDSSEFITDYTDNQTQPHHLLVIYRELSRGEYSKDKYVSILDDDSFPHHKPISDGSYDSHSIIVGWSHGLVCLYNPDSYPSKVVIWNPSIRKYVRINYLSQTQGLGFGVCPKTFDIKLVKISHYEAKVYTLRLGAWRSISINLPRKPRRFPNNAVVIDGVIHWLVEEKSFGHWLVEENSFGHLIISFDLKTEEFREVYLPDSLAGSKWMSISKLNESVAILDYGDYSGVCDVWIMYENGVSSSSFIKLFTVKAYPYAIIGFRKNGQLVLRHHSDGCYLEELQAFDPDSKHMCGLGTAGTVFELASYTESLLLLNHSDSTNDDDDRNIYGTQNTYAAGPSTVNELKINKRTKSSDNRTNKRRKH